MSRGALLYSLRLDETFEVTGSAPLEALGEGYRRLEADTRAEHSQCRLCKLVAILRRERREAAAAAQA